MAFNPYFFNDSPLPMELIEKALREIGLIAPTVDELKKTVDKLVADLDGAIQDEVARIIDEMYENGELAHLLAFYIAQMLEGKSGNIDLSHMGYILHKAHSYGTNDLSEMPASIEEELYSALQGNTVFEIDGNMYWACCYVCQNGSTYKNNNGARLYVYTINQDGSLTYVTDKEYSAVGHCNSMCYCDGYLYIAPNSYAGAGGGYTTDILRVSFDGETLGGTDAGNNKYTMERRTPTGWLYVTDIFSDSICSDGKDVYICDGQMNFYKFDWTSSTVTVVYERINGIDGYTGDGCSVDDNYIYMGAPGYRIKRYNRAAGVIDWVYQLPALCNNKMWKLGELEGFTVINNIIYIAGFYNLSGKSLQYTTYSVTHFYRQNLANNNIPMTSLLNWSNGSAMELLSIWVSGNLASDTDNSRNGYGLTEATAFPSINMALDFFESCYWLQRANIVINQYRNMEPIDIRTTKPVTLTGYHYYDAHNNEVRPTVNHININAGTNVDLDTLNFNAILPSDIGDANAINCCIYANKAVVCFENLTFPVGTASTMSSVLYAMQLFRTLANIRIGAGTTEATWNAARTKYVNSYISTINGHGGLDTTDSTDIIA